MDVIERFWNVFLKKKIPIVWPKWFQIYLVFKKSFFKIFIEKRWCIMIFHIILALLIYEVVKNVRFFWFSKYQLCLSGFFL